VFGIRKYLAVAGAAALLGAGGYGYSIWAENASLSAQNASLVRSKAALIMQGEQSREARRVEAARADRLEARTKELNVSIEALLTGDTPDAPLDPRIADFINGMRNGSD